MKVSVGMVWLMAFTWLVLCFLWAGLNLDDTEEAAWSALTAFGFALSVNVVTALASD